jgi:hypothetical protein
MGHPQRRQPRTRKVVIACCLEETGWGELPRVFRTGKLRLIHTASCAFRYSSRTSCGVLYPSVE